MKESLKKISINELYDLIKLYKQATINGKKIELIISYPFENGVYDYSKRVITLGICGGFSRDRVSFIVDSVDFDKYILPNIVEYYSYDDSLSSFDKTYVPNFNIYKAVSETQSGNLLYVEDKEDKFDLLVKEKKFEKPLFTNTDKVWEEILNYAKERKKIEIFYRSANFTHREIGNICNFAIKLSDDKKINIGNRRKSLENNINYVTELFKDKEKVLSLGLNEEIYKKIVDTETIPQVAQLVGYEKRLRTKVDKESPTINERVRFAIDELDKVDYFDFKNSSLKSFKNKDFLTSKPLALVKLKHIEEEEEKDNYERFLNYQKYCDEILSFLERNAKRNEDEKVSKIEKNIELESYDTTMLDSYDELWDAVYLVIGARVNNEKYEIVVEDNQENGNIIVRVSLISSIVKTDTFIFEFTDKDKLKEELDKIQGYVKKLNPIDGVVIKFLGNSEVSLNSTSNNDSISNDLLNNNMNKVMDNNKNNIEKENKNDIINKLIKIKSQDIESNKEITEKKSIKNLGNINIPNNNEKMILNSSDNLNVNTIKENEIDVENNKEIKREDLEKIEKFLSDYMLEKENKKEFVEIPFMNLSISTYELLINKYKEKLSEMYINNLLPKDEKEIIDNIKSLKSKLEVYYNETVERSASLIEEEIKRLANCEVALASIYKLEMISDNKNDLKNDTPSDVLKSKVYQKEYKENDTYIDKLTEEYINKYRLILRKYDNNKKYDEKELIGDKDTLLQVITYKMKLKDAYDNIISKDNLSQEDLSLLAKYERILYEIYSVDVKYQDNIENKIKELKNQEKFLTPSSKIYLSSLEKEINNKNTKKESEYLFEIISNDDVKENNNDEVEVIKKAYYEALAKSTNSKPLNIRIDYSNSKEEAELIIYNFGDKDNEYVYQKTLSSEDIKNLIPTLCELFNENKVDFVFKYNIASSDNMCLLGFTQDKKSFKIVNADQELIDYAKDKLEGKIKKEEGMKK